MRTIKKKKKSKVGYVITDVKKIAVLKMLKDNGGNLMKTARESGISRPTLQKWSREPEDAIIKEYVSVPQKKEILKSETATLCDNIEERIAELTLVVKHKALQKMESLIDKEKRLDNLAKLFIALTPKQEAKQAGTQEQPGGDVLIALQQTTNNYLADSQGKDDVLKTITLEVLKQERELNNQ